MVDLGRGTFAHGQAYVALSRCRCLEHLVLTRPLKPGHLLTDWRVGHFLSGDGSEKIMSMQDKMAMITQAISDKASLAMTWIRGPRIPRF